MNQGMPTIEFRPAGREFLACSCDLPEDWKIGEIPPEEPNFDDPTYFLPLAAAVSPDGAGALTVGARMAYDDGTLLDWLQYLCAESNVAVENIERFEAGGLSGVRFEGIQRAEGAALRMNNLYIEDGGRLYAVCAMAAEALYEPVAPALQSIVESFRLAQTNGPTVPLSR